jgi:hypothetical protein
MGDQTDRRIRSRRRPGLATGQEIANESLRGPEGHILARGRMMRIGALCPSAFLSVVVALGISSCQREAERAQSDGGTSNTSAWVACREFEPIARDLDRGLLSDAEFRAGIRRVYDTAVATPSDVLSRAEQLLRVVTQGGTAPEWRQAFLGLAEACARVRKAELPKR